MSEVFDHKLSAANNEISIVKDEPGPGGASHDYHLSWDTGGGYIQSQRIKFQTGAIKEVGRNSPVTDEALLAICIDRLRGFQSGPFACRENAIALTNLETGLLWLKQRTLDRMARGVEGLSKP